MKFLGIEDIPPPLGVAPTGVYQLKVVRVFPSEGRTRTTVLILCEIKAEKEYQPIQIPLSSANARAYQWGKEITLAINPLIPIKNYVGDVGIKELESYLIGREFKGEVRKSLQEDRPSSSFYRLVPQDTPTTDQEKSNASRS